MRHYVELLLKHVLDATTSFVVYSCDTQSERRVIHMYDVMCGSGKRDATNDLVFLQEHAIFRHTTHRYNMTYHNGTLHFELRQWDHQNNKKWLEKFGWERLR
jgi:hypothetical protein